MTNVQAERRLIQSQDAQISRTVEDDLSVRSVLPLSALGETRRQPPGKEWKPLAKATLAWTSARSS